MLSIPRQINITRGWVRAQQHLKDTILKLSTISVLQENDRICRHHVARLCRHGHLFWWHPHTWTNGNLFNKITLDTKCRG
jgi:hypothetical protein